MQVHEIAVPTPEPMPDVSRRKAVGRRGAGRHQRMAADIMAGKATFTPPAGQVGLDCDPITIVDAPDPGSILADIKDSSDRLMARYVGITREVIGDERTPILLDIAAAHSACLDTKNGFGRAHWRDRPFLFDNPAVANLQHDTRLHGPFSTWVSERITGSCLYSFERRSLAAPFAQLRVHGFGPTQGLRPSRQLPLKARHDEACDQLVAFHRGVEISPVVRHVQKTSERARLGLETPDLSDHVVGGSDDRDPGLDQCVDFRFDIAIPIHAERQRADLGEIVEPELQTETHVRARLIARLSDVDRSDQAPGGTVGNDPGLLCRIA